MLVVKSFPVFSALFVVLILGIVGFVILDSAKSELHFVGDSSTNIASPDKDKAPAVTLDKPIPQNIPVPAKKLHQLINATDKQLNEAQSLDKKVQGLDKQLAEINAQLKAQGINFSGQVSQDLVLKSDIENRLNAIKEHLKNTN